MKVHLPQTTVAINAKQIMQLVNARTGLVFSDDVIRDRLLRRKTPGYCPVRPLHARLSGRKNGVVIDANDYPAFEAWIADRPIDKCPALTADELAAVGAKVAANQAA